MPRCAAFLRAVSPMNAKMGELIEAFEGAGFKEVKTVLGSGNVVFGAKRASNATLERRAEAAMTERLGHHFFTIVRPIEALKEMLASDLYEKFRLERGAKRIVTFLRGKPKAGIALPTELDGARILVVKGREVFSAYLRHPKGPVFMRLIEKTFGKEVTTRTWETVGKVVRAGEETARERSDR